MKLAFWSMTLLALVVSHTAALAQERPLICFGNEPSWRLDLVETGKARFSTPDSPSVDYVGASSALVQRKESVWRGWTDDPTDATDGDLVAFLREAACSDQMSDTSHPYAVNVSLPDGRHLAGCCRVSGVSAGLENGSWRLTGSAGDTSPADQGRNAVTVNFEAGRVHGFSGCNQFTGSYTLAGERLVLGTLGGTMMACPEPAMARENSFLALFSGTLDVSVVGDDLVLTPTNGGDALRFERQAPPRLEGVQWEVTGYNNGRHAVVGPKPGTRLTLMFQDGQLSGSSGCNQFHGSFEVEGKTLTIQVGATTRMACEDAVMSQEQEFLSALQSATTWDIVRGMLDVHRGDGERVLTASEVVD